MKLLAFTDLHLSSYAFKKIKSKVKRQDPDLIICAGDVSIFEQGLDFMLNNLNKLKKKNLIIHGNHETDKVLKKVCLKYNNLIFIHKKHYKQDNHIFFGYGGSGFALIEPGFYKTGEKFQKIIRKNKKLHSKFKNNNFAVVPFLTFFLRHIPANDASLVAPHVSGLRLSRSFDKRSFDTLGTLAASSLMPGRRGRAPSLSPTASPTERSALGGSSVT